MSTKRKAITTLFILSLSLVFGLLSQTRLPLVDATAEGYFTDALKDEALAYAAIRGVNAVVSVLKESEVVVSPVGVGVNIAVGQILDPIDNMTERASSLLVTAIIALGLQKLAFEVGGAASFQLIALLLLITIPPVWMQKSGSAWIPVLLKGVVVLLLLRLLLPISSYASNALHEAVFQPRIDEARESLSVVSSRYDSLNTLKKGDEEGFFSSIVGKANQQVEDARHTFEHVAENVEQIVSALLELATLYVALFLVQVLAIPIFTLWLIVLLVRQSNGLRTEKLIAG
ncbi:hypothetical protein [Solemya velesiana gill symbiont]|uniref:hypothetical protein n=1 Tax=Solemya velesiana gill symbiont TaxID=1918948 RepID=UPI0010844C85|nr:hypothetical protein [Solemya velesiana gill symbiont]